MVTEIKIRTDELESILLLAIIWNGLMDEKSYSSAEESIKKIITGRVKLYRIVTEEKVSPKSIAGGISMYRYIWALENEHYIEFYINESGEGLLYAVFDTERSSDELKRMIEG